MIGWQAGIIAIGDWLLGWTLGWPRDLTLLAVAGSTAAMLLTIRRLFGSQDRLHNIAEDERRLRELSAEARARGDTDAVNRHRLVRRLVAGQRVRAELLPALVGLLPALFVFTWGIHRLEYLPLHTDEDFDFSMTLPVSAVGSFVHIVPKAGLTASPGWIRPVTLSSDPLPPLGHASWTLRAESVQALDQIILRHRAMTWVHPIMIDQRTAPQETVSHGGDVSTQIHLTAYRPFGCVPAIAPLGLQPWLVGLLGLTLAAYLGAKRILSLL